MAMLKRRRRRTITPDSDSPVMLMNLSLFIMLLAFFIVLNAISSFIEEKSYPVVQSVQTTFSTQPIQPDISPSVTPEETQQSIHEGQTIERIDALFKSQITSYDAVKNEGTGTMEVTLPIDVFANSVMAIGQEDMTKASPDAKVKGKKFFLPTLASIIKSDKQGVPYRMDILLHVDGNPAQMQNLDPKVLAQTMTRGSQLTAQLEKNGVPQRLLSIGVEKGDANTVRLLFRPHEAFTPLRDESGATP